MKAHETVTIYQDPITQLKPEGKALLLRKVDDLPGGLERWKVSFDGDAGAIHTRVIKVS